MTESASRYWEARWRDEEKENARLRDELRIAGIKAFEQSAEIERLKGELQSVHAHLQHYRELVDKLRAELALVSK